MIMTPYIEDNVGVSVVIGIIVGFLEGFLDGFLVGILVDGFGVCCSVGWTVGGIRRVGNNEGLSEGNEEIEV